ncbi:peptidoglycan-binding protein [Actinophytocola sp.]|uniref:peptidoglycan-binding protein n=1 Tax=Actinophytocola sp. TaxID=1872138 RepID=UPI002D7F67FC|nr:peptidoglycan-binding protein [Actinophytocola sp.]HET9142636.1 peptidoglycan-binding protein [Actinophytocola sp.]
MSETLLKRGDSSDDVRTVQERLTEIGYSAGGSDGDYGRKTEEAVQAFQAAYGLPITGSIDNDTWGALFSTPAEDPTAHDPSEAPTGDALVDIALKQVNDRYDFGTDADENNPNEDTFDCAELISWSCAQLGIELPSYSVSQMDAVAAAGLECSVEEASGIRGALLFREAGHNGSQYNHVALSVGSGNETIEAMGTAYGVAVGTIGHRFTRAGLIPGITYS